MERLLPYSKVNVPNNSEEFRRYCCSCKKPMRPLYANGAFVRGYPAYKCTVCDITVSTVFRTGVIRTMGLGSVVTYDSVLEFYLRED